MYVCVYIYIYIYIYIQPCFHAAGDLTTGPPFCRSPFTRPAEGATTYIIYIYIYVYSI